MGLQTSNYRLIYREPLIVTLFDKRDAVYTKDVEIAKRECALALLVESSVQVEAATPYCQAAVHAWVGVAVAVGSV